MFSADDLVRIQEKGMDLKQVEQQLADFRQGYPFMKLKAPATIGSGILKIDHADMEKYLDVYEREIKNKAVVKFVPASGAASRMFKVLFSFLEEYLGSSAQVEALAKNKEVKKFFSNLGRFAFQSDLEKAVSAGGDQLDKLIEGGQYAEVLEYFLTDKGLNYGTLPKGLLKFHRYEGRERLPVEEHIVEGVHYARSGQEVNLHFTVSPEHQHLFERELEKVVGDYEKEFDVEVKIAYSTQKGATDTIAVDMNNEPFRNADGSLLFRPAGHGALLENLNAIEADLVFLKNIDNVVPDRIKETTYIYKKLIGGTLLEYQASVFSYIEILERGVTDEEVLREIEQYLTDYLGTVKGALHKSGPDEKAAWLLHKLRRPIRVCGMVINQGEAGGGPFWVTDAVGTDSLQVVETAQVDVSDSAQKDILQSSTHFNPVDVVCGLKDHKGRKYNLMDFRDPRAGFISVKSKDGKDLKAMELPGLWNGSMADWNTVFVEVPAITFNPVKSVNDLLRPEHLP
ncbi:MAG: DUF4301 family protein [Cyclobacteriaceae bacterium]|nr:DUF4301 family protein [Cyclobacteriaceae bacterium]